VIDLLLELSKDFSPNQYICKLILKDDMVSEISIFGKLEKSRPEIHPLELAIFSAFSYGPYIDLFGPEPDINFEHDFIGFGLSHVNEDLDPNEDDKKLFAYKGEVHILTAAPYENHNWAIYDKESNRLDPEIICEPLECREIRL
jgi:hypothetical protein